MIKSTVVILSLLLASTLVNAATVDVNFTPPIQREDGTAITIEEIGSYRIYSDKGPELLAILPPATSGILTNMPNGAFCIVMTTVDTDGRESVFSNQQCGIVKGNPNAPSSVSVSIQDGRK